MILLFLGPICFLAVVEILKITDKNKIECFKDHIKSEDEECFSSVGEYQGEKVECERLIQDSVDSYLEQKKPTMNAIILTNLHKVSNCVFAKLKLQDFFTKKVLLSEVLKHTKISWKFYRYFERKVRLTEVEQQLDRIEKQAIESCGGNTENSDEVEDDDSSEFTGILEQSTETPTTTTKSSQESNEIFTTPAYKNYEGSVDDDYDETSTTKVNEILKQHEGSGDHNDHEGALKTINRLNEGSGDDDEDVDSDYGSRRRRREISLKQTSRPKDDDFVFL